jgi:hypothetical protein
MNDSNLTDAELIRAVDNDPEATPRERELAERLQKHLDQENRRGKL